MIYLAGPITSRFFEERNIQRFFDTAKKLRELGYDVFCPPEHEKRGRSWEEYLADDIEVLRTCEAIFLMDGWEKSRGARLERAVAKRLGLKIAYICDIIK